MSQLRNNDICQIRQIYNTNLQETVVDQSEIGNNNFYGFGIWHPKSDEPTGGAALKYGQCLVGKIVNKEYCEHHKPH